MSEQERLRRAEVLLLVSIAEASDDPFPKGLGTPQTMEAVGGWTGVSRRRGELEGALGAAQAARVLSDGSAERLRELARGFDRPAVWPGVSLPSGGRSSTGCSTAWPRRAPPATWMRRTMPLSCSFRRLIRPTFWAWSTATSAATGSATSGISSGTT